MKIRHVGAVLILAVFAPQALAYGSKDEMIDDNLGTLRNAAKPVKMKMLERLQWSGLSDERLFDEIANLSPERYQSKEMDKAEVGVLSHRARALGFSGNAKYRSILEDIQNTGGHRKLRGHAKKALAEMDRFRHQNELVAQSKLDVSGKPFEVGVYMKMLATDEPVVQRNGARAIYHENVLDAEVMALIADKLKAMYLQEGLSADAQDTGAWFAKVLGEKANVDYRDLLTDAAENSPSKKVRKYALKYTK